MPPSRYVIEDSDGHLVELAKLDNSEITENEDGTYTASTQEKDRNMYNPDGTYTIATTSVLKTRPVEKAHWVKAKKSLRTRDVNYDKAMTEVINNLDQEAKDAELSLEE